MPRRPSAPAPGLGIEDIPDELLATIPELAPHDPALAALPHPGARVGVDPAVARLRAAIDEARREMDAVLARVEDAYALALRDADERLREAQAQVERARAENDRMRSESERRNTALRELKRTLEGL